MNAMLRRKIESQIVKYFQSEDSPILLIEGARQVGKSYIIRHLGQQYFTNFVELNMIEDRNGPRVFDNIRSTKDLYMSIQSVAGKKLGDYSDTLVFIDEIQEYENLITMLKFLKEEHRYRFIASGSMLGVSLKRTGSIPVGNISIKRMYPLDFEEFLWANGVPDELTESLRSAAKCHESIPEGVHNRMMDLFRDYLITGGLPYCVDLFCREQDIVSLRDAQLEIHRLYSEDCSKYDGMYRMRTRIIYDLISSNIENRKKRIYAKDIESKDKARFANYREDFETIVSSGVALETVCCADLSFPLLNSTKRNMVKLYMNDVGILSALLYKYNIKPLRDSVPHINLGNVYECVVAMQLASNGHSLYYTDNKKAGEVDFVIDDYNTLSTILIGVKSEKDFRKHRALDNLMENTESLSGIVLSNNGKTETVGKLTYLPIYLSVFL